MCNNLIVLTVICNEFVIRAPLEYCASHNVKSLLTLQDNPSFQQGLIDSLR